MFRGLHLDTISPSDTKDNVTLMLELLGASTTCREHIKEYMNGSEETMLALLPGKTRQEFASSIRKEENDGELKHCITMFTGTHDALQSVYKIRSRLSGGTNLLYSYTKPVSKGVDVVMRVVPPNASLAKMSLLEGEIDVTNELLSATPKTLFPNLKARIASQRKSHKPVQSSKTVCPDRMSGFATLTRDTPTIVQAVQPQLAILVRDMTHCLVQNQVAETLPMSVVDVIKQKVTLFVNGRNFFRDITQALTRCEVSVTAGQLDVNSPFPFVLNLYGTLEFDIATTAMVRECVRIAQHLAVGVIRDALSEPVSNALRPLHVQLHGTTEPTEDTPGMSLWKRVGMLVVGIVALVYSFRGVSEVASPTSKPKPVEGTVGKIVDIVGKLVFVLATLYFGKQLFSEFFQHALDPTNWGRIANAMMNLVMVYMIMLMYCMFVKKSPLVVYCMII